MRNFGRICAALAGSVIYLAAVLKLMDPVGTGLIVEEYFKFLHLRFLIPAAAFIGTVMSLLEATVGIAMVTGVWRKITAIVSGCLLGFFTILTLVLWIADPPMDCGCFGEAIHLTHLQTLVKNLVLDAFWAVAYLLAKAPVRMHKGKYASFGIVAISTFLFMIFSHNTIPLIDFTPMAPGEELMHPEEAYGSDSPILSFSDARGEYMDGMVFGDDLIVVSVYTPKKIRDWNRIISFLEDAKAEGMKTALLTASYPEEMKSLLGTDNLDGVYFADRRTLLTLNRENGGATLISDGMIVGKWASRKMPDREKLMELAAADKVEAVAALSSRHNLLMQSYLLYVFAVMLLV